MENVSTISALFSKYLEGRCSPEEVEELVGYFDIDDNRGMLINCILTVLNQDETPDVKLVSAGAAITDRVEATLTDEIRREPVKLATGKPQRWYWAAAAILIVGLTTSLYFFLFRSSAPESYKTAQADILPGYNQATLTLGDGTTINLDSAKAGIQVNDEHIFYNDGTKIKTSIHHPSSISYHCLSTPKGGQYQIILSDGTKVWLNAASSLAYPASFASLKERRVRLTGEGYFEVAPDKSLPFRVETSNQEIEVVGTHFNVSSYHDELQERTTLVEGAVIVTKGNDSEQLNPGQEATIKNGIQVSKADVEAALAWQKGKFVFNDESLESIMRKVSRWYNVEIVYDGADRNELFGGSFSRYGNVSLVLKTLESTGGIHFKIEGRRITAMK